MSNIDKQGRQVQRYANFGVDMMEWADGGYVKHSDYLALLDELEAANKMNIQLQQKCEIDPRTHQIIDLEERIAELEARQPYGYLRENDGQIQISIGSNRPHDRSGGCATPWFAIYTAAGTAKGE